ncbi:MAG: PAS domain S-box protein [Anaerolineales bacterium]|nr:PAS domain S-box protein [Anaerolineales bacterium]
MNDNGEERGTHHPPLAINDRFYQRLFQFNTNGCLITDTEGVIHQANPAATTLLNASEALLTGQSLAQFLAEDDRPTWPTYLTQLRDNRTTPVKRWEVRVQPAGHPAFTALLAGTAVDDGDGHLAGLLWELQNLTPRRPLEQELHESRRRLQALFDHAQDSILLANDDARYVDVNPAACALLGYSREELLAFDLWRLTPAVNRDAARQQWQAFLAAGRLTGEYRLQRKDGVIIVVNFRAMAHIVPGLHLSVLRDITGRKQAEQEILHQRDRARALADISDIFAKSGLDMPDVWQQIVQRTVELIGDTCVLTLLSDDEQWLIPCAFYNPDPAVLDYMAGLLTAQPSRVDAGLPGRVVRTGQPLLIPEVAVESISPAMEAKNRPFMEKIGIYSLLIVPLRVPDRIIGTLGLSRDRPGAPYTADHQLFLQQIADRAALFVENARLFGEVKHQTDHLRALARRLAETQEIERQALARELHDQVGQNLTGLDLNLNIIQAQLAAVPAPTRDRIQGRLADSMALVEDMAERVRDLMSELLPSVLDDFGLIAALKWYGQRFASRVDFAITVRGQEPVPRLAAPIEYALFRITQEALTNVAKHAQASAVTLTIDTYNGFVRLVIADDGCGFKPLGRSRVSNRQGWGLPTMAERAEAVGCRYRIESEPGQGTRVVVEAPQLTE